MGMEIGGAAVQTDQHYARYNMIGHPGRYS